MFQVWALCNRLHCLPSQLGREDDLMVALFMAFMAGEGQARDTMPAPGPIPR